MKRGLTFRAMKWGLFAAFFAVAPAPVVVFESFMTGPVVFVAATAVSLIRDSLVSSGAAGVEIVGYFLVHLTIYLFLYGVAASALAKGMSLIGNTKARAAAFAALAAGIGCLGVLPLYGGAGIHGGVWGSLAFFFDTLNRSHFGPNSVLTIYGPAALALGCVLGVCWAQKQSARGHTP